MSMIVVWAAGVVLPWTALLFFFHLMRN